MGWVRGQGRGLEVGGQSDVCGVKVGGGVVGLVSFVLCHCFFVRSFVSLFFVCWREGGGEGREVVSP